MRVRVRDSKWTLGLRARVCVCVCVTKSDFCSTRALTIFSPFFVDHSMATQSAASAATTDVKFDFADAKAKLDAAQQALANAEREFMEADKRRADILGDAAVKELVDLEKRKTKEQMRVFVDYVIALGKVPGFYDDQYGPLPACMRDVKKAGQQ